MNFLGTKSASVGLLYIALCAAALSFSQRRLLGLVTDARDGALRELLRDPAPADVLCFGSSATARAVRPEALEQRVREARGESWRVLNLAPFGVGRHIGLLEFEHWLDTHAAPRFVVVEVGVTADLVESMHQMLPRYMGPGDAARVVAHRPYRYRDAREQRRRTLDPPSFDPWGAFTALDRQAMHLELALRALGRGPEDVVRAAFNLASTGGDSLYFRPGDPLVRQALEAQVAERGFFRVTPESAEGVKGKQTVVQQAASVDYERALTTSWNLAEEPDVFAEAGSFRAARLYAEALAELAKRRGVRVVFLDLPNFRGKPLRPSQIEFYSALGELVQLDKAVLYREESFQDVGHLSLVGAEHASRELADRLLALEGR
jgi:hypothetical protein